LPTGQDQAEQLVIWFRTDAVLVTDTLAPVSTVDDVVAAISAALGHEVTLVESNRDTVSHAVAFGRAEGWQTRWTRPRPTLVTVAAGSVVVLRGARPIPGAAIAGLQRDGIGERRAEGFGLLAINDPLLNQEQLTATAPTSDDQAAEPAPALDDTERRLVDELRRSALHRDVEQRAATLSARELGALWNTTATQRANFRAALTATDPKSAITHFLDGLDNAKVRRSRWSKSAEAALRALATSGGVWSILKITPEPWMADHEIWALRRVLAHLQAGGAAAAGERGVHDGA
jgi:CRISPR-associated protein Csx10